MHTHPKFGSFAAMLSIVAASAALAHEFWVQPDSFRPAVGAETALRLIVGEGFPGEHKTRDAKKIERFDIIAPGPGATPVAVAGTDGSDPVGLVTPAQSGVYAVVYRGKESTITLDPDKFEAYLREEGLDEVRTQRAQLNESKRPGREAYSRCAKALLCAGGEASGAWDVRAGLTVEIVPASNPYAARAGDTIEFLLLRDGKPVPGAQLTALSSEGGRTVSTTARTDAAGRAPFTLARPGLWVLNAVLMERVDGKDARSDVDWVSVWSSLSFDVAPAPVPIPPAAPPLAR